MPATPTSPLQLSHPAVDGICLHSLIGNNEVKNVNYSYLIIQNIIPGGRNVKIGDSERYLFVSIQPGICTEQLHFPFWPLISQ